MRDFCQLKCWSMIQATGYYGWDVGKPALDATNFWGITAGSATRDRCLSEICHDLPAQQTLFLGRETAASFTIDNYMKSLKLRTQRGGKGTAQLSGTTDSVELVARAMVVDCGVDPNDKTARKLSTEEEVALNREIAEKVNEMMNDDENR